ncbi:hypothetical protein HJC23_013986 [Cyclotella cryptica]|uniref:Clavaminate synthase-like protein n=1 Tax=Cyclotella cryptica TaxID=29204 RepID=A0ABD3NWW4_9STRA|eukprot:CCRYP_019231-RA/>CCRYP_019231-RA protein AED:0.05 eAED:-0.02 QI:0/-1/0/1/-1/1/1/0/492
MKLAPLHLLLTQASIVFGAVAPSEKVWEPPRLDYRDLLSSIGPDSVVNDVESKIKDALLTGIGVLSITNAIPQSRKNDLYDAMIACYSSSDTAKEVFYPDGTKRSTWAAPASSSLTTCDELSKVANPVRKQVGEVVSYVALLMEALLVKQGHKVVFPAASARDGVEGYSLRELFSEGEQLDHFHIYSNTESSSGSKKAELKTIDWHTDYGFALAFLPGHIMIEDDSYTRKYTPSKGFFIQLPDGSTQEVSFTEEDDVVILLGDGVAHIKDAIKNDVDIYLRAVPHAFVMPDIGNRDALRMWYGRMMLFPLDAIHPTLHQSFGSVQMAMNADPSYHLSTQHEGRTGYPLGCSSLQALSPRLLADETMNCTSDQFMCWHTCFNNTEDLSPDVCQSRNLELACVSNIDGTLWDGETHGKEFEPACISPADETLTEEVTDSAENATIVPSATPNPDEAMSSTSKNTNEATSGSAKASNLHQSVFTVIVGWILFLAL